MEKVAVTHNEIIKVLSNNGIENATVLTEDEAKSELVELFKTQYPEDYELVEDDDIEDILEEAFNTLNEEEFNDGSDENEEDDETFEGSQYRDEIQTDAYEKSQKSKIDEDNSENGQKEDQDEGGKVDSIAENNLTKGNKAKKGTTRIDVSNELANSLPTDAKDVIANKINSSWSQIMQNSNNSCITAFAVDTPIINYLKDVEFVVTDKMAKEFLEKWDDKTVDGKLVRKVVDDNEYDKEGNITKEGENMANFKKIKSVLQGDKTFKARCPGVKEQKVRGVIVGTIDGTGETVILKNEDIGVYLVSELGGRIPGDPGIIVNGISLVERNSSKSTGQVKTEKKTVLMVSYKGKGAALAVPDNKYIIQTAEAISEEEAKSLYNKEKNDFTAKSELSVKVNTTQETEDENGNKITVPVTRTVRLSGKIKVPFFKRMEAYSALGDVAVKGRVSNLTLDDAEININMIAALSVNNSEVAAKFSIENTLKKIKQESTDASKDEL